MGRAQGGTPLNPLAVDTNAASGTRFAAQGGTENDI